MGREGENRKGEGGEGMSNKVDMKIPERNSLLCILTKNKKPGTEEEYFDFFVLEKKKPNRKNKQSNNLYYGERTLEVNRFPANSTRFQSRFLGKGVIATKLWDSRCLFIPYSGSKGLEGMARTFQRKQNHCQHQQMDGGRGAGGSLSNIQYVREGESCRAGIC